MSHQTPRTSFGADYRTHVSKRKPLPRSDPNSWRRIRCKMKSPLRRLRRRPNSGPDGPATSSGCRSRNRKPHGRSGRSTAGLDRIGVGYRGPNRFGTDFTSCIPIAPLVSCIVAVAIASSALSAREYRSRELTPEFQRERPCPSTGFTTGACPGYRKDHIKPLACGGPDAGLEPAMASHRRRQG